MGTVLPTQNIYVLHIHTKEILASSANCLLSKNFLNKEFLFKEIKEMKHKLPKLLSVWEEKVSDNWKRESTVLIKIVIFFTQLTKEMCRFQYEPSINSTDSGSNISQSGLISFIGRKVHFLHGF